jgi:hypothetical protein
MLRENYVAKQQRIGERLTRAMVKAHKDRRALAALKVYSEEHSAPWLKLISSRRGPAISGRLGCERRTSYRGLADNARSDRRRWLRD